MNPNLKLQMKPIVLLLSLAAWRVMFVIFWFSGFLLPGGGMSSSVEHEAPASGTVPQRIKCHFGVSSSVDMFVFVDFSLCVTGSSKELNGFTFLKDKRAPMVKKMLHALKTVEMIS